MAQVIIRKKKSFWKKLIRDNIFSLLFFIFIFSIIIWHIEKSDNYEIEYVEYRMEKNDSLFNVVQDMNEYVPWGWDTHDFVRLAN